MNKLKLHHTKEMLLDQFLVVYDMTLIDITVCVNLRILNKDLIYWCNSLLNTQDFDQSVVVVIIHEYKIS